MQMSIEELVRKTADGAKKWDRPSFVGSVASMVQHLNAACKALMREIIHLEKENSELVIGREGSPPAKIPVQYHALKF